MTHDSDARLGAQVGKHLSTATVDVTPEFVATYIDRTADANPWYVADSPFGGPVAPATLFPSHAHEPTTDWYPANVYGNLHTKQEWWMFQPVMVGDRVQVTRSIVDRYTKRDRDILVCEVNVTGEDGGLRTRSRTHQSFLREDQVGQSAPVVDNGSVVDKGSAKSKAKRPPPGSGDVLARFGPVTRLVDLDLCNRYVGEGNSNYHNDADAAKKLGFPGIVVQGTLAVSFLSELMSQRFGIDWWRGGRLSVNFVNVLWSDESVDARGVIRSYTPEGSHQRADCEIWTEKPDGTVTIVGGASVAVLDRQIDKPVTGTTAQRRPE